MHSTNKAFERYYQMDADDLRAIYEDTQAKPPDTRLTLNRRPRNWHKVLKLKE
jgi:hypothetical protein